MATQLKFRIWQLIYLMDAVSWGGHVIGFCDLLMIKINGSCHGYRWFSTEREQSMCLASHLALNHSLFNVGLLNKPQLAADKGADKVTYNPLLTFMTVEASLWSCDENSGAWQLAYTCDCCGVSGSRDQHLWPSQPYLTGEVFNGRR